MAQQYDEKMMSKLLHQPKVKKQVDAMTPETLAWFKERLVTEGIYAQFVAEQKGKRNYGV